MTPETATLLRKRAREIAPALLVSAAVLLVVDHWKHFGWGDMALLGLILASAVVQIRVRDTRTPTPKERCNSGKRVGRGSQEENHEAPC